MRRNAKEIYNPYSVLILHNVMSDWTPADIEAAEQAVTRMKYGLTSLGMEVSSIPVRRDIESALRGFDPRECIVFNWCEGLDGAPNAYDAIPPILERLGFMYTGSDASCLNITEDKVATKEILRRHRVPTPQAAVYSRPARNGWVRFPALVKPATEHCSFGITRDSVVDNSDQLRKRVEYVLDTYHCKALVEDFIDGPEYNVSLWGNDRLDVLPLACIDYSVFPDYHDRLCSFDAKWEPSSEAYLLTSVRCPAPVEEELAPPDRKRLPADPAFAARAGLRPRGPARAGWNSLRGRCEFEPRYHHGRRVRPLGPRRGIRLRPDDRADSRTGGGTLRHPGPDPGTRTGHGLTINKPKAPPFTAGLFFHCQERYGQD